MNNQAANSLLTLIANREIVGRTQSGNYLRATRNMYRDMRETSVHLASCNLQALFFLLVVSSSHLLHLAPKK